MQRNWERKYKGNERENGKEVREERENFPLWATWGATAPASPRFLRGTPWLSGGRSRRRPSPVPAGTVPDVPAPSCASPTGTCSQMCTHSWKPLQKLLPSALPSRPRDQGSPLDPPKINFLTKILVKNHFYGQNQREWGGFLTKILAKNIFYGQKKKEWGFLTLSAFLAACGRFFLQLRGAGRGILWNLECFPDFLHFLAPLCEQQKLSKCSLRSSLDKKQEGNMFSARNLFFFEIYLDFWWGLARKTESYRAHPTLGQI